MKKNITIDDVAKYAGVSRQTVSRAINNMNGISEKTRQRVLATIEELGYRPSRLARGMASNQSKTIGLVIGNILNPAHSEVIRGLETMAQTVGYNVFIRTTNYVRDAEIETINALISENVDGIVLSSTHLDLQTVASFADKNLPIVVVHRNMSAPNLTSITTDIERATQSLIEYLIGSGHRKVGLLTRPGDQENIFHVKGYKKGFQSLGLEVNSNWIMQASNTNLEAAHRTTKQLVTRNPDLTAIVAYNDMMAIAAMHACRDMGLNVPDDISVIGYDDISVAAHVFPALTTLRIPSFEIGQLAMEQLLEMIKTPDIIYPPTLLDIELVLRGSTKSRQIAALSH